MRKIVKDFLPPISIRIFQDIRIYLKYLNFKKEINKNIKYKNIHKGKRCFILGSGTSINKEDLKVLKDEIVFAVNNFYVHEDFDDIMSGNTDKYYMTAPIHPPQTYTEWKLWFKDMEKKVPLTAKLFVGINPNSLNAKKLILNENIFTKHNINYYYTGKVFSEIFFNKNNLDLSKPIYSADAVSLYALTTALYMGFDEIYLLGMDHDYFLYDNESEMRMYKDAIHQKDEFKRKFGDKFYINEFLRQYRIFTMYETYKVNHSSKIFNATSTRVLKVFPSVKFKELFNE